MKASSTHGIVAHARLGLGPGRPRNARDEDTAAVPHMRPAPAAARRFAAGLAFTLTLAAAGSAMADGAETVQRWYEELRAIKGLAVSHGAVTDEAGGKTVGRNMEVGFKTTFLAGITDLIDPIAITVEGRWSTPAFMATDLVDTADGYRAAVVEIPEQSFELKATVAGETLRVGLAMTDIVMRDGSWPRLPELADEPARPVSRFGPLVEAVLRQSWAEQTVATMELAIEAPMMKQVTRSGPNRLTGMINGRIAELTTQNAVTTGTVTVPGENGAATTTTESGGSIRRVTDTGYDFLPLVRAVFGLPQAAPRSIVLESEVIEGLTSTSGDGKITVARSATRGVSIGTPAVPLSSLYDRLIVDGTVPADVLVNTFLATLESLGVAEAEAFDVAIDGLDDATSDFRLDAKARIREMRFDDWQDLALGGFSMSGLSGELRDAGSVSLDRFAVRDFAWPRREAIVAAVRAGVAAEVKAQAAAKAAPGGTGGGAPDIDGTDPNDIDPDDADPNADAAAGETAEPPVLTSRQILDLVPTVGEIELAGLGVDAPSGETVFGLGSFRARFSNYIAPVPTDVRIELSRLHVPGKFVDDADLTDALTRFGIDAIDLDSTLSVRWDEASGDYTLDPFEIAIDGVGRYTNRFKLGNVPRSVFADPENAQAALPQITFESSTSSLTGGAGLGRYLASLARDAGVPQKDIIEGFAEEARQSLAADAGDAFANKAADAVRGFLTDPSGSLVVSARPKAPVPLAALLGSAMMSPGSVITLLNVTIDASKRL